MLVLGIYFVAVGWTEIKCPWKEMNQVFEGEGAELTPCSPEPPLTTHARTRAHTHTHIHPAAAADLCLKRGLLEKPLFSSKKASVTRTTAKTCLLRVSRA